MCEKQGLIGLMFEIAEAGISIVVRVDAERDKRLFTLIGPNGRICDTDDPRKALQHWWDTWRWGCTAKEAALARKVRDLQAEVLRLQHLKEDNSTTHIWPPNSTPTYYDPNATGAPMPPPTIIVS